MNPLTRALKLAEDPPPDSVACTADPSPPPAIPRSGSLGPIRATRDDPIPQDLLRAPLAPMRAPGGDPDPEYEPPPARVIDDASGPETARGVRLAPMRAARAGVIAEAAVPGDSFATPEPSAPAAPRTALAGAVAGASSDFAVAPAGDAEAARAIGGGDFRSLRRGRGIGRRVGIALSLLAVAGAAAVGGTLLWKTGYARHALVRHLPTLPVAAMVPAPVQAADAEAGGAREPAAGTTPRTEALAAGAMAVPRKDGRVADPAAAPDEVEHAADPAAAPAHPERRTHPLEAPRPEDPPNPVTVAPDSERQPAGPDGRCEGHRTHGRLDRRCIEHRAHGPPDGRCEQHRAHGPPDGRCIEHRTHGPPDGRCEQ